MNIEIPDTPDNVLQFRPIERKNLRKIDGCKHRRFWVDELTGDVECRDCGKPVSQFHALLSIAKNHDAWARRLNEARAHLAELKDYAPHLLAAKRVEAIWRGKMLPACPHCNKGIEPEKFGFAQVWNPKKGRRNTCKNVVVVKDP